MTHILYDCGICGGMHPWSWDGDCREDANRYFSEADYAERNGVSEDDVIVLSLEEAIALSIREGVKP